MTTDQLNPHEATANRGSIEFNPMRGLIFMAVGFILAGIVVTAMRAIVGEFEWNGSAADWKAVLGLGGGK
ncbi:MAG: hypothetical protein JWO69_1553, partial [Thermoleophilia bacterium]|nr:hypothetical protein [Thermoleophilia bacterium]